MNSKRTGHQSIQFRSEHDKQQYLKNQQDRIGQTCKDFGGGVAWVQAAYNDGPSGGMETYIRNLNQRIYWSGKL